MRSVREDVSPEARQSGTLQKDAMALVREFFGPGGAACDPDAPPDSEGWKEISFLIATLPDPVDSRLDYFFDRHFDALQRALETQEFVLDRFQLPWPAPGAEATPGSRPHPIGEPGVVLFRNHGRLLVLFVVGETATAGIDKAAFRNALDQMAHMHRGAEDPASSGLTCARVVVDPIRVAGPTFSGSATSLLLAIQGWRQGTAGAGAFTIISGSASAIPDDHDLRKLQGVAVSSMVRPDADVLGRFLDDLARRGVPAESIAILTEGNTGYGSAIKSAAGERKGLLSVPFPLHIADLRKRREQKVLSTPSTAPGGFFKTDPSLPVQTRDPARETLPTFSDLESASVEPLLESMLTSLARQRIRYVGIAATDVRDTIFLALEVRRHAPNVAVFTLSADNLYLHASVHAQLQGMLILSNYPLFPPNRLWSHPSDPDVDIPRLQFPTTYAQGTYNATLQLLGRSDLMLEVFAPFSHHDPNTWLPVWLTAVGGNGLWPIALIGEPPEPAIRRGGKALKVDLGRGLSEGGPVVLLVLWCLASLLAAFELRRFFPPQPTLDSGGHEPSSRTLRQGLGWLRDGPKPGEDIEQQLNILAAFTALLDVHLLILAIWGLPVATQRRAPAGLDFDLLGDGLWTTLARVVPIVFAMVVTVVLGAGFVCAAERVIRRVPWRRLLRMSEWRGLYARGCWLAFLFLVSPLTVALAIQQGIAWLSMDPTSSMLLFVRATTAGSGFSPLAPSFLAGMALLALVCCTLRRTHLREEGTVLPSASDTARDGDFMRGVVEHEARIQALFRKTLPELPRFLPVLTLFAILLLALLSGHWARTLEQAPFDNYFRLVWAMAYLVIALEFVRFAEGWRSLRQLLWHLRQHPSFEAYKEIRELPIFPKSTLTMRTTMLGALHVCVDRARELLRAIGRSGPGTAFEEHLKSAGDRLHDRLQNVQTRKDSADEAKRHGARTEYLVHLQGSLQELNALTRHVAWLYEPYWKLARVPLPEDDKAAAREREFVRLGQQVLASRFVLFIQQTIRHLQGQIMFVMIALLLMLLAVTSYPFQPRGWLLLFNWALIMTIVLVVFWIFLQMNRNEILSELTGTTPGAVSVDRQLIGRVLAYGFVPVLGLLRAQYPGVFEQLLSWFGGLFGGAGHG